MNLFGSLKSEMLCSIKSSTTYYREKFAPEGRDRMLGTLPVILVDQNLNEIRAASSGWSPSPFEYTDPSQETPSAHHLSLPN